MKLVRRRSVPRDAAAYVRRYRSHQRLHTPSSGSDSHAPIRRGQAALRRDASLSVTLRCVTSTVWVAIFYLLTRQRFPLMAGELSTASTTVMLLRVNSTPTPPPLTAERKKDATDVFLWSLSGRRAELHRTRLSAAASTRQLTERQGCMRILKRGGWQVAAYLRTCGVVSVPKSLHTCRHFSPPYLHGLSASRGRRFLFAKNV